MKTIIYHGSKNIISKPQFGKGMLQNDYGRGFYCTEQIELAKEWACADNTNGFANKYELDTSNLSILNLNDTKYSILTWLAVLTQHRSYWEKRSVSEKSKNYLQENFSIDISGYDCILGYRANDSYFSFAQDFVAGTISLQQLREAMHLGKLGEQIVLKSQKAFNNIVFIESFSANKEEWFLKKIQRDRLAREEYRETKNTDSLLKDIYMLDIMREGMKSNDARLF